ncbi:hypothetical protein LZ32DRAFT_598506 [Colletotrichum eremochloae]|nr:hypothetical protein LZ32DRAFT_598506 [Colletotrichum eremochloae]
MMLGGRFEATGTGKKAWPGGRHAGRERRVCFVVVAVYVVVIVDEVALQRPLGAIRFPVVRARYVAVLLGRQCRWRT